MSGHSPFISGAADWLTSIPQLFQQVLPQLAPDHPAFISAEETLTYHTLATASQGVATALATLIGYAATRPEQKAVALLLPHSAVTLIGIMGTLEAGHFYVPLDLIMGEPTLQQILADCPPQAIVTTTALRTRLPSLLPPGHTPPVLTLDTLSPGNAAGEPRLSDPQAYASIQYTSGSTGRPRGVIRPHATNLHSGYLACHDLGFTPQTRVSHLLSYAHAFSSPSIFGGLLNGSTLVTRPMAELTPTALYHWIEDNAITNLNVSVGLLRGLAELAPTHPPLTSLRTIGTGGEVIARAEVERFCRLLPDGCKLVVRLASTEAGTYARFIIEVGKPWDGHQTPAGYVPPGQQVMILDEDQQPVAPGEQGEIAVRSPFLCAGYWQRPAENAAKFLPDPEDAHQKIFLTGDIGCMAADGLVEHLGRKDFMVKIRGYRVQLEAVEAALTGLSTVQAAVVVAQPLRAGEKQLVAYVVPATEPGPTATALQQALHAQLPSYMVPARFKVLSALPLTPSGKVDRQALPSLGTERPLLDTLFVAPRNAVEAQIATIWEEILEIYPIGIHDDFFALGGHSLMLLRLSVQLQRQFGRDVSLRRFLQGSTIEKLAEHLTQPQEAHEPSAAIAADSALTDLPPAIAGALAASDHKLLAPYLSGQAVIIPAPTKQQLLLDRVLPYATRIRLFRRLGRTTAIQNRFFARESRLVRQLCAAIGSDPIRTQELIANHLLRHLCKGYCRGILARTLAQDITPWVNIAGQTFLDEARQRGRGVILLNIHGIMISTILPIVLKQLGYGELLTYVGKAVLRQQPELLQACQRYFNVMEEATVTAKFLSLQVDLAQQKLKAGGIVWIAPDGGSGKGTITLPVLGQERAFSTGFAALSLQTGAVAIPTRAVIMPTGKIQITFLPPLDSGAPTASDEVRVQSLLQQYVDFLEATWQLDPGNINIRHIQRYLANRQESNTDSWAEN